MQVSLFDEELDLNSKLKKGEELVLTKDLKISEYMTTHIIKIDGVPYIKRQLKESKRWDEGSMYEEFNRPFINEICAGCLKEAYISELNEYGSCYKHGKPKRNF